MFVSQLVKYARACSLHGDFVIVGQPLTTKLMYQFCIKQRFTACDIDHIHVCYSMVNIASSVLTIKFPNNFYNIIMGRTLCPDHNNIILDGKLLSPRTIFWLLLSTRFIVSRGGRTYLEGHLVYAPALPTVRIIFAF